MRFIFRERVWVKERCGRLLRMTLGMAFDVFCHQEWNETKYDIHESIDMGKGTGMAMGSTGGLEYSH